MDIETLVKSLNNRLIALEAKKKVAIAKGKPDLLAVFDREYNETLATLEIIRSKSESVKVENKPKSIFLRIISKIKGG